MGFRDRNSYSPCVHGGSNSQVLKLPFASDPRVSASCRVILHEPGRVTAVRVPSVSDELSL